MSQESFPLSGTFPLKGITVDNAALPTLGKRPFFFPWDGLREEEGKVVALEGEEGGSLSYLAGDFFTC